MSDDRNDITTPEQGDVPSKSLPVRWPEAVHRAEQSVEKLIAQGCAIVFFTVAATVIYAAARAMALHGR